MLRTDFLGHSSDPQALESFLQSQSDAVHAAKLRNSEADVSVQYTTNGGSVDSPLMSQNMFQQQGASPLSTLMQQINSPVQPAPSPSQSTLQVRSPAHSAPSPAQPQPIPSPSPQQQQILHQQVRSPVLQSSSPHTLQQSTVGSQVIQLPSQTTSQLQQVHPLHIVSQPQNTMQMGSVITTARSLQSQISRLPQQILPKPVVASQPQFQVTTSTGQVHERLLGINNCQTGQQTLNGQPVTMTTSSHGGLQGITVSSPQVNQSTTAYLNQVNFQALGQNSIVLQGGQGQSINFGNLQNLQFTVQPQVSMDSSQRGQSSATSMGNTAQFSNINNATLLAALRIQPQNLQTGNITISQSPKSSQQTLQTNQGMGTIQVQASSFGNQVTVSNAQVSQQSITHPLTTQALNSQGQNVVLNAQIMNAGQAQNVGLVNPQLRTIQTHQGPITIAFTPGQTLTLQQLRALQGSNVGGNNLTLINQNSGTNQVRTIQTTQNPNQRTQIQNIATLQHGEQNVFLSQGDSTTIPISIQGVNIAQLSRGQGISQVSGNTTLPTTSLSGNQVLNVGLAQSQLMANHQQLGSGNITMGKISMNTSQSQQQPTQLISLTQHQQQLLQHALSQNQIIGEPKVAVTQGNLILHGQPQTLQVAFPQQGLQLQTNTQGAQLVLKPGQNMGGVQHGAQSLQIQLPAQSLQGSSLKLQSSVMPAAGESKVQTIQLSIPNQQALQKVQFQIKQLGTQKLHTAQQKNFLQQLLVMQQKILAQGKPVETTQSTQLQLQHKTTSTNANVTLTAAPPPQLTLQPTTSIQTLQSQPILLQSNTLPAPVNKMQNTQSLESVISNANKGQTPVITKIPQMQASVTPSQFVVNTSVASGQLKIGNQTVTLSPQQRQAVQEIQQQLKALSPEQQQLFLKQNQQSIVFKIHQQQPNVQRPSPTPTKVPIQIQNIPKGIKRPASGPVSKTTVILQQLAKDQTAALKPDCKTPFKSRKDAIKRLLKYHVYNSRTPYPSELNKVDQLFEHISEDLLARAQQMMNKYRYLLLQESMRLDPSAEMVMIERMFIQDEKTTVLQDKKAAASADGGDSNIPIPIPRISMVPAPVITSVVSNIIPSSLLSTHSEIFSPQPPTFVPTTVISSIGQSGGTIINESMSSPPISNESLLKSEINELSLPSSLVTQTMKHEIKLEPLENNLHIKNHSDLDMHAENDPWTFHKSEIKTENICETWTFDKNDQHRTPDDISEHFVSDNTEVELLSAGLIGESGSNLHTPEEDKSYDEINMEEFGLKLEDCGISFDSVDKDSNENAGDFISSESAAAVESILDDHKPFPDFEMADFDTIQSEFEAGVSGGETNGFDVDGLTETDTDNQLTSAVNSIVEKSGLLESELLPHQTDPDSIMDDDYTQEDSDLNEQVQSAIDSILNLQRSEDEFDIQTNGPDDFGAESDPIMTMEMVEYSESNSEIDTALDEAVRSILM